VRRGARRRDGHHDLRRHPGPDVAASHFDRAAGFRTAADAVRARRVEDVRALNQVGAEAVHLNCLDGTYAQGEPLAMAVTRALDQAEIGELVLGPLGLRHPDHEIVAAAFRATVRARGLNAWIYEELPYAYLWPEYIGPGAGSRGRRWPWSRRRAAPRSARPSAATGLSSRAWTSRRCSARSAITGSTGPPSCARRVSWRATRRTSSWRRHADAREVDFVVCRTTLDGRDARDPRRPGARRAVTVLDDPISLLPEPQDVALAAFAAIELGAGVGDPVGRRRALVQPARPDRRRARRPSARVDRARRAVRPRRDRPRPRRRWIRWRGSAGAGASPAPLPKVAVRPYPRVTIHQGNHSARLRRDRRRPARRPPLRAALARADDPQGAQRRRAYAATDLPEHVGAHWRQWNQLSDEQLGEVFRTYYWSGAPRATRR
jgi:hypothetical protein